MEKLTERIFFTPLRNRVFTDTQVQRLVGGSAARRYGLVNRALAAGELERLIRGHYILHRKYRDTAIHPFAIAQAIMPGSYVSFESALSHHGWIPEAVPNVSSVTPGRKSKHYTIQNQHFSYSPLAINRGSFLEQVQVHENRGQRYLIARPMRALADLACRRKWRWQGLQWFEGSLRIDSELLGAVSSEEMQQLKAVYSQKTVVKYLDQFSKALGYD